MQAIIASQDKAIAKRIRSVLQDRAWQCDDVSTTNADELDPLLRYSKAEMVVVVLIVNPSESNTQRLREKIKGKMVVVGPPDPKIILGTLHHCGADEYVNMDDLEAELDSVLKRSPREAPGRLIAILSPSGGGGSTTLAVNLAAVFAEKTGRCALLDLNLASGDAAAMLDLKPQHSIADFSRNAQRMDRTLFNQLLTSHESGLALLAAPLQFEDIPDITIDSVRGAISLARATYPYVIADIDQSCSAEQIEALRLADVILIVFQLDFVSMQNVRKVIDYLDRSGVAKDAMRLVANRYGQSGEIDYSQVESALKMKIGFYLPEDSKDVHRALNTGIPVVVDRPRTKISRSISDMSSHINGVT